ncbi:hypothetical protein LTR39_003206, partial [Cryomyces antarcticus]
MVLQLVTLEEPGQFTFRPVARSDEKEAPFADQGLYFLPVAQVYASAPVIDRIAKADGVEGAFVKDNVKSGY